MLVMVPRLAAAFVVAEPGFMGLDTAWLTGPGYGVLAVMTAAYSLQVYQQRKSLKLARWILAGWGVILLLASAILMPGMLVMVRRSELAAVLPFPLDVIWCAVLAISPEIIVGIAGLAFALSSDAKKKTTTTTVVSRKKVDKPDMPAYIIGQLPDTKWTEADFVRLVPDPAALTPSMRQELSIIAGVHPRTIGRWQDRADSKMTQSNKGEA